MGTKSQFCCFYLFGLYPNLHHESLGHPAALLLQRSRHHLEKEVWCGGCSTMLPKPPRREPNAYGFSAERNSDAQLQRGTASLELQIWRGSTSTWRPGCPYWCLLAKRAGLPLPDAVPGPTVLPRVPRVAPPEWGGPPLRPHEHCPKLHADVHRGGRLDRPRCPDGNCEPLEPHRQRQKYEAWKMFETTNQQMSSEIGGVPILRPTWTRWAKIFKNKHCWRVSNLPQKNGSKLMPSPVFKHPPEIVVLQGMNIHILVPFRWCLIFGGWDLYEKNGYENSQHNWLRLKTSELLGPSSQNNGNHK